MMKMTLGTLFLFAATVVGVFSAPPGHHYIAGGESAGTNYPGVVSIQTFKSDEWWGEHNWKHICGGVVLNSKWILTAAHCVRDADEWGAARVMFGSNLNGPTWSRVDRTIMHPLSGDIHVGAWNDIALVELEDPHSSTPACVAWDPAHATKRCVAVGWGKNSESSEFSSELMQVRQDVLTHNQCQHAYRNMNGVRIDSVNQLCAGRIGENGKGVCHGDTGGPLVCNSITGEKQMTAIASSGDTCGSSQHPGIFVRVAPFISWIQSTIGDSQLERFCNDRTTTTSTTTTTTVAPTTTTTVAPTTTTTESRETAPATQV